MTDKKIIMEGLTTQDFEIMEAHFRNMANDGLLIDKIKYRLSFYKRIQPKDIQFAVGVYPKAKAFEKPDERVTADYVKVQKEKGWKHVFSHEYTHVFMNEDGKVIEDIDRTNGAENIKSVLKPEMVGLIFAVLINVFGLIMNSDISIYHFRSNFALLSLSFLPVIIIAAALYLIYDIFRYIRISRLDSNDEIQMNDVNSIVLLKKIWSILVILFFLIFVTGIIVDSFISGSRVFILLIPVIFVVFLAYRLSVFFPEFKIGSTTTTMIAIVSVFLVALIVSTGGIFSTDVGLGRELPQKYSALKLKDIGIEQKPEEVMFNREGSILIPLSYNYREEIDTRRIDSISVYTQVDKVLSKTIADYAFKLDVEGTTRYFGKAVSAKEYYTDYDDAYFINFAEGETIEVKLQKGEYIFSFSGDCDLQEASNIEVINDTVDKIIIDLD